MVRYQFICPSNKKVVDALVEHFGPRSREGRRAFENTSNPFDPAINNGHFHFGKCWVGMWRGPPTKNRDPTSVRRVPILSSHSLRALRVISSECKNRDPTDVRRVPTLQLSAVGRRLSAVGRRLSDHLRHQRIGTLPPCAGSLFFGFGRDVRGQFWARVYSVGSVERTRQGKAQE